MAVPYINDPDDVERYPWPRVHPRAAAGLVVAFLVVLVAGVLVLRHIFWPSRVFVTDGSKAFGNGRNLHDVEAAIKTENQWVAHTGKPYVSIAVMLTMSPNESVEPVNDARVRRALEGAYIGQHENNHPSGASGLPGAPLVKLLLADEGSQEKTWRQAAKALEKHVGGSDHLVAVTGLGISVTSTNKAIAELGSHQIAMVGAVTTGDDLSNLDSFFRVAPDNSGEAAAAAAFLNSNPGRRSPLGKTVKVWMVQDQNREDNYGSSLGTSFQRVLTTLNEPSSRAPHRYQIVPPGTTYDSSLPDASTVLATVGDHVCDSSADVVYFAGRGTDFQGFLAGLGRRYCAASQPLTVLTGSDATELIGNPSALWPSGTNISVYYTALAHPDMWNQDSAAAAPGMIAAFEDKANGFFAMFPREPATALDDGWAIMFHDAVLTAETATANGYLHNSLPSTGEVTQLLYQVRVKGLSGYICLDGAHDPRNKAIPIVQLYPRTTATFTALYSSSGGQPTNEKCQ